MSESHRIFLLRNRTISAFYNRDPSVPTNTSVSNQTSGEGETLQCYLGNLEKCTDLKDVIPCVPGTVTNLVITSGNPGGTAPPPYIDTYSLFVTFSWDPVPNATDYIITTNDTSNVQPLIIYTTGTTDATMYYNGNFNGGETTTIITVTAVTPCGNSEPATTEAYPCFLAGSIVQMADNTTKVIEDVQVGDQVLGAFGEINTVLALHRPLVGSALMCKINNEHNTTNHHPHISIDKKFYCGNPVLVQHATYGRNHKVINAAGVEEEALLLGLKAGRIQQLELGINLKTVEGSRQVNALETYSLPPETQLYNLVVSGSHTYHVDGYAVTGWPREDDFDYDAWTPLH
jgi:hypothetical protein